MSDFFPYPGNLSTLQDIMVYNNTITNDLFGVSILMMVFGISFITMQNFGNKPSLVASLWITSVISIFLWVLQLISPDIMVALTVMTAMATIFLFRTREN